MSTVAQRLNGAAPHGPREKDDFYPTPPEGTRALLLRETFDGPIWEPACGDGAICKVLADQGYDVIATDLVDRGYGNAGVDFLMEWQPLAPNIITNPPFKMSVEFVRKALTLTTGKVAMLMQLRFLEGLDRARLFRDAPPSRVYVFSRRLPMPSGNPDGTKGGMLAFAWFVWDRTASPGTSLSWIMDEA